MTRAHAQADGICAHPTLSGTEATTTLTVEAGDRTYPRLTAATEYEIPPDWPGVVALLGRSGEKEYDDALRCFLAEWPLNQLKEVGEYRPQPPVVRIREATLAADGKPATPERIVLSDMVTGVLTSRTAPPLLGPWEVALDSDGPLQLRLINGDAPRYVVRFIEKFTRGFGDLTPKFVKDFNGNRTKEFTKDFENLRPGAFSLIKWTAQVRLSGLRFYGREPKPASTDEREASWGPFFGDESKALRIGVNLDLPTRMVISSGSGTTNAISHISAGSVGLFFYALLIFLLFWHRKDFMSSDLVDHENQRKIRLGVIAALWILTLGLLALFLNSALYWWHGKDTGSDGRRPPGLDGREMPTEYWKVLGLVGICMVGLVILFFAYRVRNAAAKRPSKKPSKMPEPDFFEYSDPGGSSKLKTHLFSVLLLMFFGSFLILYGVVVLMFPEWFNLNPDFYPMSRSEGLTGDNIYAGGGQIGLMVLFACAVLFVTATVFHFIFWSLRAAAVPGAVKDYRLPFGRLFAASLLVSLALMWQWVSQQWEFWDRNYVFTPLKSDRNNIRIADVIGRMFTYCVDLFVELTMDSILWVAIAVIIYTLFWLGRGTASLRPSLGEYRLLGLVFAASASTVATSSSYVGFTVPVVFFVAFFAIGYVLPWTLRFNLLEKIRTEKRAGHKSDLKNFERELAEILDGKKNGKGLRGELIAQQMNLNSKRDQMGTFDEKLKSGEMTHDEYHSKMQEIVNSLAKIPFPPASVEYPESLRGQLPRGARPVDVALAIGPGARIGPGGSWWENGVRAAGIGACVGALATVYFSYIKIKDAGDFWFGSYLGLLRLLRSMVWEFGFWVIAAFVLGCLWRTVPGSRGPIKGLVLWLGYVIPFAVDFALRQGLLHQDRVHGAWSHAWLLLSELLVVGLALDWFTLRDADKSRAEKRSSFAAIYGLRGFMPATLSTVLLVVLSFLPIVIEMYSQSESGSTFSDISRNSGPPPISGRPR